LKKLLSSSLFRSYLLISPQVISVHWPHPTTQITLVPVATIVQVVRRVRMTTRVHKEHTTMSLGLQTIPTACNVPVACSAIIR